MKVCSELLFHDSFREIGRNIFALPELSVLMADIKFELSLVFKKTLYSLFGIGVRILASLRFASRIRYWRLLFSLK